MQRYLSQLRVWYGALEGAQRRQLWVAVLVAGAALAAVGWWSSSEDWRPFVDGRTYEEMLWAASALSGEDIPHRIVGDTLEVPHDHLGAARAATGTIDRTPSLEDVAKLKVGLPPSAQEWAFRRALEGDLARMINGIQGINLTQVSIVPREESLYFGEERPASAAVAVRMRPGASLDTEQVKAITNMVAHAVDGLSPGGVSVTDDQGHMLAEGRASTGSGGIIEDLHHYRAGLERRYERAVGQALLPMLGSPGAYSVAATVDLDLTSTETVSKRVEVDTQGVLSEQMDESNSSRSEPGGIPGVDANLPERAEAAATASDGTAQTSSQSSSTFNYVYPTVDEIKLRPAGGVTRVSTAVQVDQAKLAAMVEAGLADDVRELQKSIQEAVRAAVGFSDQRGDVVSVGFVPFAEREWVEGVGAAPPAAVTTVTEVLPWAVGILALVLVFAFVVRPVMSRVTGTAVPRPKQLPDASDEELEPDPDADLAERLRLMVANFQPVDSGDLNRLVERQAVAAAQVVRQWNKGA